MNLIHRVEELSMHYGSGSRRAIGAFILQEQRNLHKYSIQEIAERTYTSKAALVRFAKELGFSGWRDFLKEFVEEQNYQASHYTDVDPNFPFQVHSSKADVLNLICSLQVESLLDTADLLDHAPLEEIVALMKNSRRVAIFGLNPNLSLAELFKRKMLSIGKQIETPTLGDIGLLASTLTDEDCAIVISYSGNNISHTTIGILPELEKKGVPVVALTSEGDNILRQKARYTLTISSRERLYDKISTFSTETSILYILNVLFSCYFLQDYDRNLEYKIKNGLRLEIPRWINSKEQEPRERKQILSDKEISHD